MLLLSHIPSPSSFLNTRLCVRDPAASYQATAMANSSGKKVVLVGLLLALLVVSSQASVTVVNLAEAVKIFVNGANVDVSTGSVKVDVKGGKSQDILVKGPNGKNIKVNVKDGDVVVLVPDILGNGSIIVNVNGVKAP